MAAGTENFLALLRPHYNDALKYCHALCRDRQDAADLFQQAILTGMEKLDALKEANRFRAWFLSIITNAYYSRFRKSWWNLLVPLKVEGREENIPDLLEDQEPLDRRCEVLFAALSQLKTKERVAILLFEVGDLSIQEIAEIQGERSQSAIKSRLSRTREKLKNLILHLERSETDNLEQGDVNHEARALISRYK